MIKVILNFYWHPQFKRMPIYGEIREFTLMEDYMQEYVKLSDIYEKEATVTSPAKELQKCLAFRKDRLTHFQQTFCKHT